MASAILDRDRGLCADVVCKSSRSVVFDCDTDDTDTESGSDEGYALTPLCCAPAAHTQDYVRAGGGKGGLGAGADNARGVVERTTTRVQAHHRNPRTMWTLPEILHVLTRHLIGTWEAAFSARPAIFTLYMYDATRANYLSKINFVRHLPHASNRANRMLTARFQTYAPSSLLHVRPLDVKVDGCAILPVQLARMNTSNSRKSGRRTEQISRQTQCSCASHLAAHMLDVVLVRHFLRLFYSPFIQCTRLTDPYSATRRSELLGLKCNYVQLKTKEDAEGNGDSISAAVQAEHISHLSADAFGVGPRANTPPNPEIGCSHPGQTFRHFPDFSPPPQQTEAPVHAVQ
ncbi:hypothetical protein C8R45DRAFT_1222472 [Mycena sanguinolenta]|nr:hypothetical protein C8R45DRAFT_1222472 [Mycena sanguinolenta]